ncbi:MAG: glycosyltransferase family 39 protein, partial [Bacteroidales bacterium]|nr:glycosyltransferase family 39 protein [Bacteroidales bacterium]
MCSLFFTRAVLPLHWIIFAIVEVSGFFFFFNNLSASWTQVSSASFKRKLFHTSLFIRITWVVFSYFFYIQMTGEPFEFDSADSSMYHQAGSNIVVYGFQDYFTQSWGLSLSDKGFPFYLSLFYFIFGDHVLIPRLFNALLGAWTVVLVYRLAGRNFGEATGRLAGIMMMLMPNLIYYCGIHLKETLMV